LTEHKQKNKHEQAYRRRQSSVVHFPLMRAQITPM